MQIRRSARAVIVNEYGEILLIKFSFSRRDGVKTLWVTPGGGLNEGEDFEESLRREIFEETGIKLSQACPWIWTKEMIFEGEEKSFLSYERYYLIQIKKFELDLRNMTTNEKNTFKGYKWWNSEEIKNSSEEFSISNLGELLTEINNGKIPKEPILVE